MINNFCKGRLEVGRVREVGTFSACPGSEGRAALRVNP